MLVALTALSSQRACPFLDGQRVQEVWKLEMERNVDRRCSVLQKETLEGQK